MLPLSPEYRCFRFLRPQVKEQKKAQRLAAEKIAAAEAAKRAAVTARRVRFLGGCSVLSAMDVPRGPKCGVLR